MAYRYTFQNYNNDKMARAVGVSLPISYKQAREICHFIKNRPLEEAKRILNAVLEMKQAIPYKRFDQNIPHRSGNIAAGRYPQRASTEILKLIESAEANANSKGLKDLFINHMNVHRAAPGARSGRTAGEAKRAHVEIVVEERKVEKKQYVKKVKTK
jgi:large subunit ribosomal protein L22